MSPSFSHSAGGVVLRPTGEVLLVQQRNMMWSLPKGKIEKGEDPREAARREIFEESGVDQLQFVRILKSYSRHPMTDTGREDFSSIKRITMYLWTTTQSELRPIDPRNPAAQWVPMENVVSLLSNPKDQEFFESILPELRLFLQSTPIEAFAPQIA